MKTKINKKEEEGKDDKKAVYIVNMADKVMNAIEEIFDKADKMPTGLDMIDITALASVFVFARQLKMHCKSNTTRQAVMKSTMWSLVNQIDAFANTLLNNPEQWDEMFDKEGIQ